MTSMSQLVKSLLSVEANVFMRNVHLFYLVFGHARPSLYDDHWAPTRWAVGQRPSWALLSKTRQVILSLRFIHQSQIVTLKQYLPLKA